MWLTLVAASAALIAVPGPNVALIVANSVAHGRWYGLVTVAGTSTAMISQLTVRVSNGGNELKTIAIVISATLAALFVHHALDQAQAFAGITGHPAVVAAQEDRLPIFGD